MIQLAISGVAGRMGTALLHAIARADGVAVSAATERADSAAIGADAGALAGLGDSGVIVRADTDDAAFDVMLEFTTPAATLAHLDTCHRLRRAMLIGTTGLDAQAEARIRDAARDIPLLYAANTSVGVNICLALVESAARASAAADALTDIEIVEAHHRHKVDAPSGTALALGNAIAAALGRDIDRDGVFARHGNTGARGDDAIGFAAIRGGDIAGEHSVLFIGDGERIEITHRATDRRIFADGAIKAAKWLAQQPPGLYAMRDVLGLG